MVSIDLSRIEQRARRKYEWARARRALVGFAPALVVVAVATLLNHHRPHVALLCGASMFAVGAFSLWYGRDLRRAVLPGLAMGLLPLSLALCANMMGHHCLGDRCMTWCIPACTLGGFGAALGVSLIGLRWKQRLTFWLGATALTLLTGAMGCTCVGYGGIAGLAVGYAVGLAPTLLRRR